MNEDRSQRQLFRFGMFELDTQSGELRKDGKSWPRIRDQALQILIMLVERPGGVVTREELRERLWSADTFVDFDHGLNTSMNQIRTALGDSATNPRFIQTLPKKGYRFIAPVELLSGRRVEPKKSEDANGGEESLRQPGGSESRSAATDEASLDAVDARSAGSGRERWSNPESGRASRDFDASSPGTAALPVAGNPRRMLLSEQSDLPVIRHKAARIVFSLIQVMYLSFYGVSLARLSIVERIFAATENFAVMLFVGLIITAAVGIPIRLYLLTAAGLNYRGLTEKFLKLFPFVLILDELWGLAPFLLVQQLGVGLAIGCTAALLYLPFCQRSLLLMGSRGVEGE